MFSDNTQAQFAQQIAGLSSSKQDTAGVLAALIALTGSADNMVYMTGSTTLGTCALTPFSRTLIANSSAGSAQSALGLGTAATQASSAFDAAGAAAAVSAGLGTMAAQNVGNWQPFRYANTSIPAGNTNTNSTGENAFGSTYTIPANSIAAGNVIGIEAWGVYSAAIVVPTVRCKIKIGSTAVIDTGTITGLVNVTNLMWNAVVSLSFMTSGASASVDAQGIFQINTGATVALVVGVQNTSTFTIDTTQNQAITMTSQWSIASTNSSIQLRQLNVR